MKMKNVDIGMRKRDLGVDLLLAASGGRYDLDDPLHIS